MSGKKFLNDSPWWTKLRRELVQWFDDRAPSFSDGYVAAVQLLHTLTYPARVHLVCHLVRDIYRYLPASFGAKAMPRPSEVYPNMVKDLAKQWEDYPPVELEMPEKLRSDILVSSQVHRSVVELVRKSGEFATQPTVGKQLAITLFHSLERRPDEFIHPRVMESFDDEFDFFLRRAHLAKSLDRVPTDDGLVTQFEAFERAFHSMVGPYFSGKEEVDDILQDTNTATD